MVADDLEVLNAPRDTELAEMSEALNAGKTYRASVYRSECDTTFYFDNLSDAQVHLAASSQGYTESNTNEGISLEVFEDGEWVDTGFTIEDAELLVKSWNSDSKEYLEFLLDTQTNNNFDDEEDLEAWISEVRGAEEIVLSLYPYVEDIEEDGGDAGAFAEMLSNRINAGVAYIAVMGNEDALLACDESERFKAAEIYFNYFL